jgi:hypothetical protein
MIVKNTIHVPEKIYVSFQSCKALFETLCMRASVCVCMRERERELNLERNILWKVLYEVDICDIPR